MTMNKKKLTSAPATGCRRKRSNRSCLPVAEQRPIAAADSCRYCNTGVGGLHGWFCPRYPGTYKRRQRGGNAECTNPEGCQ